MFRAEKVVFYLFSSNIDKKIKVNHDHYSNMTSKKKKEKKIRNRHICFFSLKSNSSHNLKIHLWYRYLDKSNILHGFCEFRKITLVV